MNFQQCSQQLTELRQRVASWLPSRDPPTPLPQSLEDGFAALGAALEELREQGENLVRNQEIVEAERARWQDVFDLAPDGCLVTDLQGIILNANRAGAEMLAVTQADLVGQPLVAFVLADERADFETQLSGPPGQTTRQVWELRLQRQRGDAFLAEMTVAALKHPGPAQSELGWLMRVTAKPGITNEAMQPGHDASAAQIPEPTVELHSSRTELQALSRRMVEVLENERRMIARELHDEAGQSLTALLLGLAAIERHADEPEVVLVNVQALQQMTDDIMDGLHRLALNLRPASLDRYGLLPALGQYVEAFQRQADLTVEFVSVGLDDQRLPVDMEVAFYRMIQEALTNVARHANATHAGVVLERRGDQVLAIIEDDGRGFDVAEAMCCDRLGLVGMRERAEMLGGSLTIESAPGKGATIYVTVPYAA